MARPEPGLGREAGLTIRDVTHFSTANVGVPRRNQVRLLGSNQQPSRPLGRLLRVGCFWDAGHTRPALFGISVVEQIQPIRPPGQRCQRAWLDPSPGREEGRG